MLRVAESLADEGFDVQFVGVDGDGRIDESQWSEKVTDDTALVSIMLANNETGVVFPLAEICALAFQRNILVHTDAVNALGKMPVEVERLGVSLLSLSGHKIYGPKGVGALYLRRGTPFRPFMIGGPQERQRRGGTLNAPGIIALGRACELLRAEQQRR